MENNESSRRKRKVEGNVKTTTHSIDITHIDNAPSKKWFNVYINNLFDNIDTKSTQYVFDAYTTEKINQIYFSTLIRFVECLKSAMINAEHFYPLTNDIKDVINTIVLNEKINNKIHQNIANQLGHKVNNKHATLSKKNNNEFNLVIRIMMRYFIEFSNDIITVLINIVETIIIALLEVIIKYNRPKSIPSPENNYNEYKSINVEDMEMALDKNEGLKEFIYPYYIINEY